MVSQPSTRLPTDPRTIYGVTGRLWEQAALDEARERTVDSPPSQRPDQALAKFFEEGPDAERVLDDIVVEVLFDRAVALFDHFRDWLVRLELSIRARSSGLEFYEAHRELGMAPPHWLVALVTFIEDHETPVQRSGTVLLAQLLEMAHDGSFGPKLKELLYLSNLNLNCWVLAFPDPLPASAADAQADRVLRSEAGRIAGNLDAALGSGHTPLGQVLTALLLGITDFGWLGRISEEGRATLRQLGVESLDAETIHMDYLGAELLGLVRSAPTVLA